MGWFHRERVGFTEFAEANQASLRRTAYLLCGDWHLAEDLAQTALEKVYVAWPKIERQEHPEAYAKRVLVNAFLDRRRRRSSTEMTGIDAEALARTPAPVQGDPELRLTLVEALHTLEPRERALLVLRYWEDLSVEETARQLGMGASAVKTGSMRALARLRERVPELAGALETGARR
ncbi:SigE family RNA polymerase sigma factor [Yinghuangia seranimata]|uniref:SigE family RNA polymerase sigma factor n=1 Tax=Yinghuangia seranimata TaxID=408067 RepID=UPI00248BDE6E|nr:SigE family RNA polymerase sigma factor [Yinghuangia seranimata]MDI2125288.1 SigE family RNA polymerase sigma factor [Yinghuangia seranimata]